MKENNTNPIKVAYKFMTQSDLAEKLGVSRQTIAAYEKNPEKIPTKDIVTIAGLTGYSTDELLREYIIKPAGPVFETIYDERVKSLNEKLEAIDTQATQIEAIKNSCDFKVIKELAESVHKDIKRTEAAVREISKKPTVALIGKSDTGKSTLVNYIIGADIAPAEYTPLTSVMTVFRHSSEKPDDIFNDGDDQKNAVVYSKPRGTGGSFSEVDSGGTEEYEEKDENKLEYITGTYKSILSEYGTRKGGYYQGKGKDICRIEVYVDAPALKEITIVDLPGFGSDDADDDIGLLMSMKGIDIVLFTSRSNGFMDGAELHAFKDILTTKIDFGKCVAVATYANVVRNPEVLDEVLESGVERLVNMLSPREMNTLKCEPDDKENAYNILRSSFLGYAPDCEAYCNSFNAYFIKLVAGCIEEKISRSEKVLEQAAKKHIMQYENYLADIEKGCIEYAEDEDSEKICQEMRDKAQAIKEKMHEIVDAFSKKDQIGFKSDYKELINTDAIIDLIKTRKVKNKKAEKETFVSYLNSCVHDKFVDRLDESSRKFKAIVDGEIEDYSNEWKKVTTPDGWAEGYMSWFDFESAFASGLVGVAAYGALAVWAAAVAGGSNLGAYILIAKVVSFLSGLGVSLGGTGAVAAAIASIGGPVVLGVGLAVIAALSAYGVLSSNWEKNFAKMLVKSYEKENVCEKYAEQIKKFWDDTNKALDVCVDSLSKESIKKYESEYELRRKKNFESYKAVVRMLYIAVINAFSEFKS